MGPALKMIEQTVSAHAARCALNELKYSGEQPRDYIDLLDQCLANVDDAERTQDPALVREAAAKLEIAIATVHQARFVFSAAAERAFDVIEKRAMWAGRSHPAEELD